MPVCERSPGMENTVVDEWLLSKPKVPKNFQVENSFNGKG
jgi:hypothetical protein